MSEIDIPIKGNKQERELFTEVMRHYQMATEDLDVRIKDWDIKDELFRSHIDKTDWPYASVVFDPRTFTAVFEKTSRLLANKPRGRMVPREGGDALGARINNELLSFQWDDNERADNNTMLSKWAIMDQNARKYGASFALCKWRYDTTNRKKGKGKKAKYKKEPFYDAPDFKPLVNRDVLANPSYSTVKQWFGYREYVTMEELERINDAARVEPVYKNLDILKDAIKKEMVKQGDTRDVNWISKNKTIKDLQDFLGRDRSNKIIEVVTEYRPNRWISYAPKHGVILRDIPNPYDHGQIPVVMLKYYIVDDDLYGLSEIEPVERLQKGINALLCQYLDAVNMSLYVPLKIRATGVQMHTIEFGPAKKWIMNDPATDIVPHESSGKGVSEFASTYRFMVGAMQEALGETSAMTSSLNAGATDKTATEIKDLAVQRNARDNFNQIFLGEAIKRQMMLWHVMDKQFMFSDPTQKTKIIRIVGKDAIRYFEQKGLNGEGLEEDLANSLIEEDGTIQNFVESGQMTLNDLTSPNYPVQMEGSQQPVPKFMSDGDTGHLIMEKKDLAGNYDYIPDIESMKLPDDNQLLAAKKQLIELILNPATMQMLQMEGYKPKLKEIMEDFFEQLGMKDADKYFEKGDQNALQAGAGPFSPGVPGQGNGLNAGMAGMAGAMAGGQAGPGVSGPGQMPVR